MASVQVLVTGAPIVVPWASGGKRPAPSQSPDRLLHFSVGGASSSSNPMEFKDYYKMLGVERTADDKAIKTAYRRLARKHHPDVEQGQGATASRRSARPTTVLADPEKRKRYDTLGPDWERYAQAGAGAGAGRSPFEGRPEVDVRFGQDGDASGFSDFFRTIFGGPGRLPPRRGRRRRDRVRVLRPGRPGRRVRPGEPRRRRRGGHRAHARGGLPGRAQDDLARARRAVPGVRRLRPRQPASPCAACRGGGWTKSTPEPRGEDPGGRGHRLARARGRRGRRRRLGRRRAATSTCA